MVELIEYLHVKGVDLGAYACVEKKKKTLMYRCCEYNFEGNGKIVGKLLELGYDYKQRSSEDFDPIERAILSCNEEALRYFVANGIDISIQGESRFIFLS